LAWRESRLGDVAHHGDYGGRPAEALKLIEQDT
jgi:hypothetical protein